MEIKKILSIGLIIFGVFSLLGALIFGGSFYFAGSAIGNEADKATQEWEEFQDTAVATEGTITNTNNGTVITYRTDDGSTYDVRLNMTSSLYPVGEEVTVYYDRFNPSYAMVPEITESTSKILDMTFSGIGLISGGIIAFIGLVMIIAGIIVGKKSKV